MAIIRGGLGDDERGGTGQRDAGLALTAGDILNGLGGDALFNDDGPQRGGAFADSPWRSPPVVDDGAALRDLILTDTPAAAVDPHLDRAFDDIDHAIGPPPDRVPGGGGVTFITAPDEDGVFRGAGAVNVIVGTQGDDTIEATGGVKNFIFARAGDDTVTTGLGEDVVFGGPGDDVIRQGELPSATGDKRFYGGPGDDLLEFESGQQHGKVEIWGGSGDDDIIAVSRDVFATGADQEVRILGGDGRDFIRVGVAPPGAFLDGGPGADFFELSDQGRATIRLSLHDVLESTDSGIDEVVHGSAIAAPVTELIQEIQVDAAGGDVFVVEAEGFNIVDIVVDHPVHGAVPLARLDMGSGDPHEPGTIGPLVADLITVLGSPDEEVEVIIEPPLVASGTGPSVEDLVVAPETVVA